ncbi:hypothetical protein FHG87_015748 [Trinorchestia longiramus]|nr:hypothetical protein FHG87_015748 [Trinorchestia longiramus]
MKHDSMSEKCMWMKMNLILILITECMFLSTNGQEMSSVKEKWCLKHVWDRNGNVNDMNKEMAKMLYATAEEIIGKVECRRFTGKAKWFTREIKEE